MEPSFPRLTRRCCMLWLRSCTCPAGSVGSSVRVIVDPFIGSHITFCSTPTAVQGSVQLCPGVSADPSGNSDASAAMQACVNQTPAGGTLSLPAGALSPRASVCWWCAIEDDGGASESCTLVVRRRVLHGEPGYDPTWYDYRRTEPRAGVPVLHSLHGRVTRCRTCRCCRCGTG